MMCDEHITGIHYSPGRLLVFFDRYYDEPGPIAVEFTQDCLCDECAMPSREAQTT